MIPDSPVIRKRNEHPISRKQIDHDCLKVLYRLHRNGFKSYLVGGSVRDLLLERSPKDFDIATDATPNQVKRLFRNCFLVGRRFRLAHIRFAGNKLIEVATFRREATEDDLPDDPGDHLHVVQNLFGTPREDAFRRDFTINALFYNIKDFTVIDHVGGLADLKQRQIRVIGDPLVRFVEDPVRMLRALEFAARLDFSLCDTIYPAIDTHKERLTTAAPARVREEIMALFRHGIAAPVLRHCRQLGMLPYLLAGYPGTDEGIAMLSQVDDRTRRGIDIDESFALAALYLRLFMDNCPPQRSTPIPVALQCANDILTPHCRYFSIAAGIRIRARDLLVGCFRLARGRGQRGEQKFLHHPATAEALELFSLWSEVRDDLKPLLKEWQASLQNRSGHPPAPARRKRRNHKKKRSPKKTHQPG
ncbi:MAG: polynucleotide adenylyltransferase PcnB [Pelovirga sp.]